MIIGHFYVYRRPFLDWFLCECSKFYEIAIWSSGWESYVSEIVTAIFPKSVTPAFVWARERCTERRDLDTDGIYYAKDLKKVARRGYPLSKVLIVEDIRKNVEKHYGNAIYITPFHGNANDEELHALGLYLGRLASTADMRKVEKRHWRRC
jgi:RNA polymerase II subunit A small phosphatase-like protein